MASRRRHVALVLVRDPDHPVRQLRLRRWQARLWATLSALLLVAMAGLSIVGLTRTSDAHDIVRLADENERLHHELRLVEGRVGELEETLRETDDFQRWTRNLADLEPLGEAALAGGVGGPAPLRLSSEAAGLDHRLDRLLGRAQVLRQSAEEVLLGIRENREQLSRVPSIRPVIGGRVSSRYGRRIDPFTGRPAFHRGLDISARRGTAILATADGRVKRVLRSAAGFGNEVLIDHGNGYQTRYAHCDRILVSRGQKVARGEVIATVGDTGHSTGPHLHYEVIREGRHHNPTHFILSDEFVVD
jgi:murein DD-endopeptidase MepM/ murein hydrolase activator NlpD